MKSSRLRLTPRRRAFARLLGKIQHELNMALAEEHEANGLTRSQIARILGADKAFITKKLTGTSNMTIETLSDLAFAMGRDVTVSLGQKKVMMNNNQSETKAGTSPAPRKDGLQHLLVAA